MTKVEYAVQWCEAIAANPAHGYDQANRWGPDYDCSSLIITAYEKAGIPVKSVAGAQRTYDMRTTFKNCGFIEVSNWNRANGVGLIRGDIVLNVQHHVELFVGNGQLLKASQNEFGGSMGGKVGDQTGNEIKVGGYYNFPWDCALRYSKQSELYTGTISIPTAYDYAISGTMASVEPDYKEIDCYIATTDRGSKPLDYKALKEQGLIGTMLEVGFLYNVVHMKQERYLNPLLDVQVKAAKSAGIRYGLYAYVRARNLEEAHEEIKWLRIYIQKYTPSLGVWLKLDMSGNKVMNDMILAEYTTMLKSAGLAGRMGLYATRSDISKINWGKWQDYYLLWLIDHIKKMSEIEQILTPDFFMLEKD